jgi:hypothetical protein
MQMLGHTVSGDRPALSTIEGGAERPFVFATFSNWQVGNYTFIKI